MQMNGRQVLGAGESYRLLLEFSGGGSVANDVGSSDIQHVTRDT